MTGADLIESTLASGLLGALIGGAVAAAITARVNLRLARDARQERAAAALWEYHRALSGFAMSLYDDAGYGDEVATLAMSDMAEVRAAYNAAYPWAGYLREPARASLFYEARIDIGMPPWELGNTQAADSVHKHAKLLREELTRVFPLRRTWVGRWAK